MEKMQSIVKRILDWKEPFTETIILIATFIAVVFFDGVGRLELWLQNANEKETIDTAIYYFLIRLGNPAVAIAATIIVLVAIRKYNKDKKLNKGNGYHRHPYWSYLFCAYLLGYRKCNLKLVPVPMQVKLVTNDIFQEFICNEGIHAIDKQIDEVRITRQGDFKCSPYVNLVLADTYSIGSEQLPRKFRGFPTLYIDRTIKKENTRYDSENFVKSTITEVRGLPDNVTTINVFATLNPMNCYNIAKEVFVMGGRTHISHLYVFPQNQDEIWSFLDKGVKIY